MTSALYPNFKKLLIQGDIDLLVDTIKAVLVDGADYTYSAAHDNLDDVPSGARVGTGTLASKTSDQPSAGVFDAADTVLSAVTGDPSEIVILYKDSGTESTSPLIAYIDGLSVTPNGGDITIQWSSGASRIFAL